MEYRRFPWFLFPLSIAFLTGLGPFAAPHCNGQEVPVFTVTGLSNYYHRDTQRPLALLVSGFEPSMVAVLEHNYAVGNEFYRFSYHEKNSENPPYISVHAEGFRPARSAKLIELGEHHFLLIGSVGEGNERKGAYLQLWWEKQKPFPEGISYSMTTLDKLTALAWVCPRQTGGFLLTGFDKNSVFLIEMPWDFSGKGLRTKKIEISSSLVGGKIRDVIAVPRSNGTVFIASFLVKPNIGETTFMELDSTWEKTKYQTASKDYNYYRVTDAVSLKDGRIILTGLSHQGPLRIDGEGSPNPADGTRASVQLHNWVRVASSDMKSSHLLDVEQSLNEHQTPKLAVNLASNPNEVIAVFGSPIEYEGGSRYVNEKVFIFSDPQLTPRHQYFMSPAVNSLNISLVSPLPRAPGWLLLKLSSGKLGLTEIVAGEEVQRP